MSTPFFDFFQVFLLLLFSRLLILLQFTRHATNALQCDGFVAGPNSAGSFYVLYYHTLL